MKLYFVKQIESETIHHLSTLSEICKGAIIMAKIPHRLYLTEDQMPKQWYNLRADM